MQRTASVGDRDAHTPVSVRGLAALAAFVLCLPGGAEAQAIGDTLYHPLIHRPAFAPGEGPLVMIDEGHFNVHVLEGSDRPFLEFLRRDGYRVRRTRWVFNTDSLNEGRILVIALPLAERNRIRGDSTDWFNSDSTDFDLPNPSAFSDEEIRAVRDWVDDGGALLLLADHMPIAGAVTDLALAFGVQFSNGHARDSAIQGPIVFRRSDGSLGDHPITNGRSVAERIDSVATFGGSAFTSDVPLEPLLVFRPSVVSFEATRFRQFTPETRRIPVGGWLQGAALRYGNGRVVFSGEAGMFLALLNSLSRCPDGNQCPNAAWADVGDQNPQFLLNILRWLSGLVGNRGQ